MVLMFYSSHDVILLASTLSVLRSVYHNIESERLADTAYSTTKGNLSLPK